MLFGHPPPQQLLGFLGVLWLLHDMKAVVNGQWAMGKLLIKIAVGGPP